MVATASFMVGTASRVYSFAGPSVVGAKYRFGSVVVGGGGAASTAVFGVSPSPVEVIAVFCGVFEAEDKLGGDITGLPKTQRGRTPQLCRDESAETLTRL
jgi:hypothetical protein